MSCCYLRSVVGRALAVLVLSIASVLPSRCLAQNFTSNVVIQTGDFPSLTLSQDNSGGFTPIDWVIGGGDTEFTIYSGNNMGGHDAVVIKPFAPLNSLFISAEGRIGLGTSAVGTNKLTMVSDLDNCVMQLQTKQGLQNFNTSLGSNGDVWFSLWDSGFINSSTPMTMQSGAPDNSLWLAANGNVGFGTSTPTAGLHLVKSAQAATAEILARFGTSDDASGSLVISNSSAGDGVFIPKITGRSASQNAALINEAVITSDIGASPAIAYNAVKGSGGALTTRPLVTYRNNSVAKVTIAANGNVIGTSFVNSSSRELKDRITDLPSDKAAAALRQLTPVEFVYKDDETADPRIGFIGEDVPALIAEPDRKSVPVMDVVALVTRVVKDQQQTIDEQKKFIEEQRKLNELLTKRLNELESLSANR